MLKMSGKNCIPAKTSLKKCPRMLSVIFFPAKSQNNIISIDYASILVLVTILSFTFVYMI